jgi:hypothetical protein
MHAVTLVVVVSSTFLAITSGVWVAIALVRAISAHRAEPFVRRQGDEENANEDR